MNEEQQIEFDKVRVASRDLFFNLCKAFGVVWFADKLATTTWAKIVFGLMSLSLLLAALSGW